MYILEITSNDVFEKILNLTYIFLWKDRAKCREFIEVVVDKQASTFCHEKPNCVLMQNYFPFWAHCK